MELIKTDYVALIGGPQLASDRHFDLLLARFSQVFGSVPVDFMLAFRLSL